MRVTRRELLAGGGALAAGIAMAPLAAAMAQGTRPVGLQLYTIRDLFAADPVGTLGKVAEIGYREIEYGGGGYETMDHAALRREMDRLGLTCPSLHVGFDALTAQLDQAIAMARTLGADTVVLPWMEDRLREPAAWRAAIAQFDGIGERLARAGLGFAYHNHDFEFTGRDGDDTLFDLLLAATDRELVKIELDLFWAVKAGQEVKPLIRRLAGHIYAYHVKDMAADGMMAAVGSGSIDFADIFTLNDVAGVRHFYVENDRAPAPYLPDIAASYAALSRLLA